MQLRKILFVKPPDRFLEDEFVYQQLGPHYLQSYLLGHEIPSDLLVLYEPSDVRAERQRNPHLDSSLEDLRILLIQNNGDHFDLRFDDLVFSPYDIIAMSVMTPQAPDAYMLNSLLRSKYPHITTVIGGSHPRYYREQVSSLPPGLAFDFVVPYDGWDSMLQIATGTVKRTEATQILEEQMPKLLDIPAPTRPIELMRRYRFDIGGAPAYHTITALGCPFTCHFCESGVERVRTFSLQMIEDDLSTIDSVHSTLGHTDKALMFFDDVGLMSPRQVERLSSLVADHGYTTWRAFTHAYLVVKHKANLLDPFRATGGKRIGLGIETGSQRSLDMINKRNGKKQFVADHFEAVAIANDLGIAVDAFTMIYPWEGKSDLADTAALVEFVAHNPVRGTDTKGRPLRNHVDSTIMSPYQGTKFYDLISMGQMPDVTLHPEMDPGRLYYKGVHGESGWPYLTTKLARGEYEAAQQYRNSLRPKYR